MRAFHLGAPLLATLLASACVSSFGDASPAPADEDSEETLDVGTDDADRINAYIRGLGQATIDDNEIEESPASAPYTDGDYRCITQSYKETRQHDKIVAFGANSESL
ncbi:MAG: hypothetical protein KJO07_00015, partial [Deltaproteobacteria bacterium]|nr:hypothetical protein [Deltaproteobacteria bacterium]